MPLYKIIPVNPHATIYIWEITESLEELSDRLTLTASCRLKLENISSEVRRKEFLSVQRLLNEAGSKAPRLSYTPTGKPELSNGEYISISHSFPFAAVFIANRPVGVDIEQLRPKIVPISSKFVSEQDQKAVPALSVKNLTILWCAKEAAYKLISKKGLSLKNHLLLEKMAPKHVLLKASYQNIEAQICVAYFEIEGFICAYTPGRPHED